MKYNDRTDIRLCDKCRDEILTGATTTVVMPNGRTRYFHDKCMPKEEMKILKKDTIKKDGGPLPI